MKASDVIKETIHVDWCAFHPGYVCCARAQWLAPYGIAGTHIYIQGNRRVGRAIFEWLQT